jgi:diguanylate cyclase (GGDEF)-like protein
VRAAVARTSLTGEALQPAGPVTVSIGVSIAPDHGTDSELLLKLADDALYQSKWTGRNRVTLYNEIAPQEIAAA